MADDGSSASDIITYIGVPLAVLGVLPILYNTFATLASLSRIRRMLRRSRLTALTRSDVINRVIEIDLPRYAVKPLDRFRDRAEYWSLSRHPSDIPGGSWSTFNWQTNTIGVKTQRVEYADDVRQPQVDISFDDLVSYLMDLGAVADPQGWKLLRSTGLWTPVGCSLMRSPDSKEPALTVAPQDNADGNLSLAVRWQDDWTSRNSSSMPPYWVHLPAPSSRDWKSDDAQTESPEETAVDDEAREQEQEQGQEEEERPATRSESGSSRVERGKKQPGSSHQLGDISCQILSSGLVAAFPEGVMDGSSLTITGLSIDHLRVQLGHLHGAWFASAATAYGTTSNTVLWNYKIPDEMLIFARRESVPCGVLVMLNIVDEASTPDWASKHDEIQLRHDLFVQRSREEQDARAEEMRLPFAERQAAYMRRMTRQRDQQVQDMRDSLRRDRERADQRTMEALQSPKWNNKLIAEHCLGWLQAQGAWRETLTAREVVGYMLHRMVWNKEFAASVYAILDAWKSWADNGGMRRADFQMIKEDPVMFAQATLLVGLLTDTTTGIEGTLALDLQECLRLWRNVRLG